MYQGTTLQYIFVHRSLQACAGTRASNCMPAKPITLVMWDVGVGCGWARRAVPYEVKHDNDITYQVLTTEGIPGRAVPIHARTNPPPHRYTEILTHYYYYIRINTTNRGRGGLLYTWYQYVLILLMNTTNSRGRGGCNGIGSRMFYTQGETQPCSETTLDHRFDHDIKPGTSFTS